jgi:bacterioferritin-associated ferredoxin
VVQPAYSDQNIRDYLSTRPNMTDAEIRSAMDDFKVTPAQMASATGLPVEQVQQRYDAPSNFSNEAIQSYLAARPGLTDMQIRSAMDEFKVTPAQMASATGLPFEQVQQRYAAAAPRLLNMGGIAALAQGGYPRRTGQISGPGTEKSDSIPAMLSDGEFVLTAKAVRGADPTGKGNRRAGAKQMYKLMHQLEKNSERG